MELVAIREIKTGRVIDFFPVEIGSTAHDTYEYYAVEIGFERCQRDEATGEAVLVALREPHDDTTPADFAAQVARAATVSRVTFGFVRV